METRQHLPSEPPITPNLHHESQLWKEQRAVFDPREGRGVCGWQQRPLLCDNEDRTRYVGAGENS